MRVLSYVVHLVAERPVESTSYARASLWRTRGCAAIGGSADADELRRFRADREAGKGRYDIY